MYVYQLIIQVTATNLFCLHPATPRETNHISTYFLNGTCSFAAHDSRKAPDEDTFFAYLPVGRVQSSRFDLHKDLPRTRLRYIPLPYDQVALDASEKQSFLLNHMYVYGWELTVRTASKKFCFTGGTLCSHYLWGVSRISHSVEVGVLFLW